MSNKTWRTYEEVAQYLLNQFAEHFKLGRVEGKQIVPGESGTEWEIDAKGIKTDGEGFLIVECRRYTKSRLNQESMAALEETNKRCQALKIDITPFLLLSSPHGKTSYEGKHRDTSHIT